MEIGVSLGGDGVAEPEQAGCQTGGSSSSLLPAEIAVQWEEAAVLTALA